MTSAQTFPAPAPPKFASIGSSYFGILLAVMAVVLILSNIGASKGVAIGPVITDGGFFLFPLAYILGDVISEVYGFRAARRAIFTGFAMALVAAGTFWVVEQAPAARTRSAVMVPICRLASGATFAFASSTIACSAA